MNRIKELRQNAKLSQKTLAEMLKVNQTAVSQWERGATMPRFPQIKKLCNIFHVSEAYLLCFDESNEKKPSTSKVNSLTPKQLKILEMMEQMTPEQQDEMVRQAEYQLWMQQHKKDNP